MAKIYKLSGYLVDPGEDHTGCGIYDDLKNWDGTITQHIHVEESDIGEWDDENPLNYDNCDLAECEKYFKNEAPILNGRVVKPGQVYRHFKGNTVKVLHVGQDTESPGFFYVVYECSNGIWCRPYGMFVSEVDHKKYPGAKQKYRFERVEQPAVAKTQEWIPITERLPEDESYILVSFENTTMPDIARYEEDGEGGRFYPGDDEDPYTSNGIFVNAWMPLPEPYRGEK